MGKGINGAMIDVPHGTTFKPGVGGYHREKSSNGVLSLEDENLESCGLRL